MKSLTPSKVALVTGLQFEAKIARTAAKKNNVDEGIALVAGPGGTMAQEMVKKAHKGGAKGIVSFGVCGGLDPDLEAGSIILPNAILSPDVVMGKYLADKVNEPWRNSLKKILSAQFDLYEGTLITVRKAASDSQIKTTLRKKTQASVVDMESAVIQNEADKVGLPFIAVRVVVDTADQTIPYPFADVLTDKGHVDVWKLINGLVFHWPGMRFLKKLSDNDQQARASLEELAGLALPDFGLNG